MAELKHRVEGVRLDLEVTVFQVFLNEHYDWRGEDPLGLEPRVLVDVDRVQCGDLQTAHIHIREDRPNNIETWVHLLD